MTNLANYTSVLQHLLKWLILIFVSILKTKYLHTIKMYRVRELYVTIIPSE